MAENLPAGGDAGRGAWSEATQPQKHAILHRAFQNTGQPEFL